MFTDSSSTQREFMKAFDSNSLRQRQNSRLSLRKKSREEHLQKRRRTLKKNDANETLSNISQSNPNMLYAFYTDKIGNVRYL